MHIHPKTTNWLPQSAVVACKMLVEEHASNFYLRLSPAYSSFETNVMTHMSKAEATGCTGKFHVAVSNENLLTYSKRLEFRSTNRSVHDCAALAQCIGDSSLSPRPPTVIQVGARHLSGRASHPGFVRGSRRAASIRTPPVCRRYQYCSSHMCGLPVAVNPSISLSLSLSSLSLSLSLSLFLFLFFVVNFFMASMSHEVDGTVTTQWLRERVGTRSRGKEKRDTQSQSLRCVARKSGHEQWTKEKKGIRGDFGMSQLLCGAKVGARSGPSKERTGYADEFLSGVAVV